MICHRYKLSSILGLHKIYQPAWPDAAPWAGDIGNIRSDLFTGPRLPQAFFTFTLHWYILRTRGGVNMICWRLFEDECQGKHQGATLPASEMQGTGGRCPCNFFFTAVQLFFVFFCVFLAHLCAWFAPSFFWVFLLFLYLRHSFALVFGDIILGSKFVNIWCFLYSFSTQS